MEDDTLGKVNPYFKEYNQGLIHIDNCSVGGNKCLETMVYMGAFNHAPNVESFIEYVSEQEWSVWRNNIQILIQEDNDDEFTMYKLLPNKDND